MGRNGILGPILRENLERNDRDGLVGPEFPYPHLKATLTFRGKRLHTRDTSNDEVAEGSREVFCLMPLRGGQELHARLFPAVNLRRLKGDRLCRDREH